MKIINLLFILLISVNLSAQDFKKASNFYSKIDSSYISKLRFSKESSFYIKTDSNTYSYPTHSEFVESRNEFYLINSSFSIDNLKIELKRINDNYWYYSESLDSTSQIKGFFSIIHSNYEIPINNYNFEIFPVNWKETDTVRYFDTLYSVSKEGDWTEQFDEFYYSGSYVNNLKESDWDLYNTKYTFIPLRIESFQKNIKIKDSIVINFYIQNKSYFYGKWKIRNELNNSITLNKKYSKRGIYFKHKEYFYSTGCGVGKRPVYIWNYDKKENMIILDDVIYKILFSEEDSFVIIPYLNK